MAALSRADSGRRERPPQPTRFARDPATATFAFAHPRIRETLDTDLPPAQLMNLHRRRAAAQHPALAAHLQATERTGTWCAYVPAPPPPDPLASRLTPAAPQSRRARISPPLSQQP